MSVLPVSASSRSSRTVSGISKLFALAGWRKDFEADANVKPARFYRFANEVPTLLMVVIVLLVILRPF